MKNMWKYSREHWKLVIQYAKNERGIRQQQRKNWKKKNIYIYIQSRSSRRRYQTAVRTAEQKERNEEEGAKMNERNKKSRSNAPEKKNNNKIKKKSKTKWATTDKWRSSNESNNNPKRSGKIPTKNRRATTQRKRESRNGENKNTRIPEHKL